MKYLGHISEDGREQILKDHIYGSADLARNYANCFGGGDIAYYTTLLHDVGKYSSAFQKRIRGSNVKVDHSTAGAQLAANKYGNKLGLLMAYCIAGHHGGLMNGGTVIDHEEQSSLHGRLKKDVCDYSDYNKELELSAKINLPKLQCLESSSKYAGFTFSTFIRMLYSCLVDADFNDTREFMQGAKPVEQLYKLEDMFSVFDKYIESFKYPTNFMNAKRSEILLECIEKGKEGKGLYTLTVPTGGGKTISSMAFALEHAKKHDLDRVIYAIPYTSIIEQNASVFKNIFGEEYVLEHHSNFDFVDSENNVKNKQKLSAENWDAPLIVTTNVQFFESFFANKSSRCRKLHNVANSIIIFDEAQMLPTDYLEPCLKLIAELVGNYGCTAILCSATQPAVTKLLPPKIAEQEIISNVAENHEFFKRTNIQQIGTLDKISLLEKFADEESFLCIVNTRKHAAELYNELNGNQNEKFHLSTLMCPKHRKEIIATIKARLKNNYVCKVISTQLIEAGVDVDFPVVYRATAGLDSIIQSAGRCNREGKNSMADVFVFEPQESKYRHRSNDLKRAIDTASSIFRNYGEDVLAPAAIKKYFEEYYNMQDTDKYKIIDNLNSGAVACEFQFADIARDFKIIEDNTKSIIIPFDEQAAELINQLKYSEYYKAILRKLQPYIVNIYEPEYNNLFATGALDYVAPNVDIAVLKDMKYYDYRLGVKAFVDKGICIHL